MVFPHQNAAIRKTDPNRLEKFKKAVIFYNYRSIIFNFPFQDPEVLDRLVDGIHKAGMWASNFKFYRFFQEDTGIGMLM